MVTTGPNLLDVDIRGLGFITDCCGTGVIGQQMGDILLQTAKIVQ